MNPSLKKTTSSLAHRAQLQISVEKQELIVIKTNRLHMHIQYKGDNYHKYTSRK